MICPFVELFKIWIVWNETSASEKWAVRRRNVRSANLSSAELQNVSGIQYTAQNAGFTFFIQIQNIGFVNRLIFDFSGYNNTQLHIDACHLLLKYLIPVFKTIESVSLFSNSK